MRQDKIDQMAAVTEALYLKEFRCIGSILSDEAELRGKLTRLDAQVAMNRKVSVDLHAMRVLGADLLWQGWTTRTRRQLNIELAQVLARKSAVMERVRLAFGRQQAVKFLQGVERADRRKRITKRFEEGLIRLE